MQIHGMWAIILEHWLSSKPDIISCRQRTVHRIWVNNDSDYILPVHRLGVYRCGTPRYMIAAPVLQRACRARRNSRQGLSVIDTQPDYIDDNNYHYTVPRVHVVDHVDSVHQPFWSRPLYAASSLVTFLDVRVLNGKNL
jgi:hypothetical protein